MKVLLAIETSTALGSVVLVRGGEVVFEAGFRAERSHNSLIFEPLRRALQAGAPELIAVGTGPGSYSGVRVGLAAAVGLGLSRGVPVVGWSSLTAFEAPARCQVVGDARRGSVFVAELSDGWLLGEPVVMEAAALAPNLRGPVFTFDAAFPVAGVSPAAPSAHWLARRVTGLSDDEIDLRSAAAPEPVYLQGPFITTPRPRSGG